MKAEICFGLGPKPKKRIQNRTIDIYILLVHEYCITFQDVLLTDVFIIYKMNTNLPTNREKIRAFEVGTFTGVCCYLG